MRRTGDLPVRVREIENLWIPARDGIRLAARAWMPDDAERNPVPVVLEYIPYRKRDMTALRDTGTHGYLAGHGYACFRLDARGTGESEGLYGDQFIAQYVEDALDAIAWLAEQSWCTGEVAMFGLSWGGAIALQTAARRPPALKTIVCAAGIDDRNALRYPGGCLATATVSAIVAQISYATRPPDPKIAGARWREMWMARLESAKPVARAWLAGPQRDAGWHADIDVLDGIACPTLISAGWADPAFAAAMLRMLERLEVPRLGIFGAWAHRYPHLGIPEPAIDYLEETLRWLDHWLKKRDTGIMDEPRLRAWLPSGFTVARVPEERPGRWIGATEWPSAERERRSYWLGPEGLTSEPQPGTRADLPPALLIGTGAGEYMPLFGSDRGPELPGDQRADDAASLVFDSAPLDRPVELLGEPLATIALEAPGIVGQLVVRLCEVAPDGRSRLISWGCRNLALSDDLSQLRARGEETGLTVDVPLYPVAETLAPGNRLRLALSTSYWPVIWPSAERFGAAVKTGNSRLRLPILTKGKSWHGFGEAQAAPSLRWTSLRGGGYRSVETTEPATGERVRTVIDDSGAGRIEEIGLEISEATTRRYRIRPEDPASAVLTTEMRCGFRRGDWSAETVVRGRVRRLAEHIVADHSIRAIESGRAVYSRRWRQRIRPALKT